MPALSKKDKLRLLATILESRHADLREQNLNRQGKGHFHVSGMGHEALAAVSFQMEPDDYIVSYYRDRGLILGRGTTTRELGLEYFAKRNTGSGGRQMPSHYSNADLHIWSVPTPTGSQLLPACGIAWGIQVDGKKNLVVTTVGDAATRQGDFFEAICFAKEKKLPMLFLVEDNGYGISMPTRKNNPLALNVLQSDDWRQIEGQNVQQVYDATAEAFERIRAGGGPFFFWIKMERLSSHTSSDDQKLYRNPEELQALGKSDPLKCWKDQLIEEGVITAEEFAKLDNDVKERIRREYAEAEKAEDPSPNELLANVSKLPPKVNKAILPPGKYRIGDTVNRRIRDASSSAKILKIQRAAYSVSRKSSQPSFRGRSSIRLLLNRRSSVSPAVWLRTVSVPSSNCSSSISSIQGSTSSSQTSRHFAGDRSAIGNARP
jgi:2-oxoisovalerate dehydrogenase E1 component